MRELVLHLDVTDLAELITFLEVRHFRSVRIERVVVQKHWVALDGAGHVGADPFGIRVHLHHLRPHGRSVIGQVDRVPVALAHLPVVEAWQPLEPARQQVLRLHEHVAAKDVVEAPHHLPRELEVRDLVLADGHVPRVVHRDVRGLQERVAEEANRRQIAIREVLLLFFVGRHPFEPRDGHHHRQQQVQLGVLGNERLDEDRALLRVDPGGNPVREVVGRVAGELGRVGVLARQRVPVGDEVETIVLNLEADPVAQRAGQMSEMELSGRAHARHHAWFHEVGLRIAESRI
jgi:hypothetical protein